MGMDGEVEEEIEEEEGEDGEVEEAGKEDEGEVMRDCGEDIEGEEREEGEEENVRGKRWRGKSGRSEN